MTFTWINGQLVLALIVIPTFSVFAVGYVNYRIRIAARRRIFTSRGGAR